MAVDRVVIIASNAAVVARLVQQIARAGMVVDAWTYRGSRLAGSRYVRRHEELARDGRQRARQLCDIAGTVGDRDWVILGTDHDLYEICGLREQGAPVEPLLPVTRHLEALASKSAMAAALDALGVDQPAWTESANSADLSNAVRVVGGHAMVKTVHGWGGEGVTPVDLADGVPDITAEGPFLVQGWVAGETRSIDLVVVDGRVACAPYSRMDVLARPYGVSCSRQYLPIQDEGLWVALDRLAGGFGGMWLANVTAIRRDDGTHSVVEVDMRPNSWHAYLTRLGYPMPEVLTAIRLGTPAPVHATSRLDGAAVVNVSRVVSSMLQGNLGHARLLLDARATWRYANRGDAGLTLREMRDVAREASAAVRSLVERS